MIYSPTLRKLSIGFPMLAGEIVVSATFAQGSAPLADIERRDGGRTGVCALDTGAGRTFEHCAGERFHLQAGRQRTGPARASRKKPTTTRWCARQVAR